MIQKKRGFILFIILFHFLLMTGIFADSFADAELLFSRNKPDEAIVLFEQVLQSANTDPSVYNYLGLAYYQTGQMQKALETFLSGTQKDGTNKRVLYYNAGNTAFAMGLLTEAENYFSLSSIADPSNAQVFLNRANTRVKLQKLSDASDDYTNYLRLNPLSPQADEIRRLLLLLSEEIQNKEIEEQRLAQAALRLKEEEARISQELALQKEEQERLAAEKAAAEAERRRLLMEEIAASLQNTESTNLSAGSEGVMEYTYESELD